MSSAEDLARLELALRLSRNSLAAFTQATYPEFLMGWLHRDICRRMDKFIDDVEHCRSPRLLITVAPRHGKSEILSRRFPAYYLGRNPTKSIIAASYSADLTKTFSRQIQRIMADPIYHQLFPSAVLPGTTAAKSAGYGSDTYTCTSDFFEIAGLGGSYRAAGVGGGITGMGAECLVIDDPIKNSAEAKSLTVRNSLWDWYRTTALTRLSPGGGVVVIQTRWHMDDLAGRLLEEERAGGEHWDVVNYPAIAEHDEKYRKAGEALHPERYNLEQLQALRRAVGESAWAALYQGRPVPDGGGIIKNEWIQYYTQLPTNEAGTWVMSWDMAFKGVDTSDYVVGQVWARFSGRFYLVDQIRGRWSFVETLHRFIALCEKWPRVMRKLVEDKANGTAVIDTLRKHIPGIIAISPKDSKETRVNAVSTLFESHAVYIPAPTIAPWAKSYEAELTQFPNGAHDDQVDATTQALNDLKTGSRISAENILALRR